MPPKRKTVAEDATNPAMSGKSKALKESEGLSAPESSAPKTKVANKKGEEAKKPDSGSAKTAPEKNPYVHLQWPNLEDFINEENLDMPKEGDLMAPYLDRVSDLGIPVSEIGESILKKIDIEIEKRDQDSRDMYIYNDWNGWGILQVLENLLKDFDRLIKKGKGKGKGWEVKRAWEIWGYVEGLAPWLKQDGYLVTMNDDGDGAAEILDMIGIMVLTSLQTLRDQDLFKPDSEVRNLAIICLMYIEFCDVTCTDFDLQWTCEIVRLCDNAGIKLEDHVRKQVEVSKEKIQELREMYEEKKEKDLSEAGQKEIGDGYLFFEEMEGWKPDDDQSGEEEALGGLNKMWYRWDWKLEYPDFYKNHRGGNKYDLTRWTKKQKAPYLLGSGEFKERLEGGGLAQEDLWSDCDSDD